MSPGYRAAHSPRDRRGEAAFRRDKIKQKVAFRQTRRHTSLEQNGGVLSLSVKPVLDRELFGQAKTLNAILSLICGLVAGGIPFYFISSALSLPDPVRRSGTTFFILAVGVTVFYLLTRRLRTSPINLEVKEGQVTDRDSSRTYPRGKCSVQLDENILGAFFYLDEEVMNTSRLGQDDFNRIEEFTAKAGIKTERIAFDADRPEPI